jgi:hypothetical protein
MRLSYFPLAAAMVTAMTFGPDAVRAAPPHKYMPAELKYLGSDSPIPAEHVRCLKIVDDAVDWELKSLRGFGRLPPNRGEYKPSAYRDAAKDYRALVDKYVESEKSRHVAANWGIPPKSVLQNMLRINEQAVTEEKKDLEHGREIYRRNPDPILKEVDRFTAFVSEVLVRLYQAYADYARCALQNDLPPTVEE